MSERQVEPRPIDADLEGLATGVELTLASVLQGIAMAILIPQVSELITSGEVAKLPYIPASLLLIFMVWIAFVLHSISCFSWPVDPLHNLLYFLVVGSETVLLTFLDQPPQWFLSLIGFGITMGLSYLYNQRLLIRQQHYYVTPAARELYEHIAYDHTMSIYFMVSYCMVGAIGFAGLSIRPDLGMPEELGWAATGGFAVLLPIAHVIWQARIVKQRAYLIERVREVAAG
jgi:hypothetical protein